MDKTQLIPVRHAAADRWWFAWIYHFFGWIPEQMMFPETRAKLQELRLNGYRPRIVYVDHDLYGYEQLPYIKV